MGCEEIRGHLLFAVPDGRVAARRLPGWAESGSCRSSSASAESARDARRRDRDRAACWTPSRRGTADLWRAEAGLKTYGEAVGDDPRDPRRRRRALRDDARGMARLRQADAAFSRGHRQMAESLDIRVAWDPESPKTPEGYYQVQGGIDYAIAKSLAAAPFADLLWMETKTAESRGRAAIRRGDPRRVPRQDAGVQPVALVQLGHHRAERRRDAAASREELGKLGFVFNFITYAGHQIDGLAAEEFATALFATTGCLPSPACSGSSGCWNLPYRTPQSLVGGDRLDAALMAASGRTAATKAMGSRTRRSTSTSSRPRCRQALLDEWLAAWASHWDRPGTDARRAPPAHGEFRPAGADRSWTHSGETSSQT